LSRDSLKRGKAGEERAILFLKNRGFEIIARNFYADRFGEIDIIATKDNILHFIEVKSSTTNLNPSFNLTDRKLQRFIKSVKRYIQLKELKNQIYSIDLITVDRNSINLYENITF
jgi:putative endonuclease